MSDRDTRPPDSRPPAPRLPEGEQATPSRLRSDPPRPDRTERAAPALRRLAAWLLRSPDAGFILDDLDELHARDLARDLSRPRAGWRYARNLCCSAWSLWRAGRRAPGRIGISWLDFKLGFRMLVKYPGLTLVGGLGIAVAIALGTVFGVAASVMYTPLPFEDGERVVAVESWDTEASNQERRILHDFVTWREGVESLEDFGAYHMVSRNLIAADGRVERVAVAEMTASGFRLARVPPLLGRPLVPADERPGAPPVVVIGYDVWRTRFASDPGVVGRTLRLSDARYTIVGVMPDGFGFPLNHEFWVPFRADPSDYERREGPAIRLFARLAPGATLEQAQAELSAIALRTAAAFPETHERLRPRVMPYTLQLFDDMEGWEIPLMRIILTLLLLVVCVNVAVLVYARTAMRRGEIAVRSALGASRRRIVAQLFIEALVLSTLAAVVGLGVARLALVQADAALRPLPPVPFWMEFGISPGTVVFVAGLVLLSAVVVGVVPALKATDRRVHAGLQQLVSGGSGLRLGGTWTALIVAQVAFAVAVQPAGIAFASALTRHGTARPGFAADEFLTTRLVLERETPPSAEAETYERAFDDRYAELQRELVRRLDADPAVAGVTFSSSLPGGEPTVRIELEGETTTPGFAGHPVGVGAVDVAYFDVYDVPLLGGRRFRSADLDAAAAAVIVSRGFADRLPGGGSPLGRRLRLVRGYRSGGELRTPQGIEPGRWYEIVGVVDDFRGVGEADRPLPRVYLPIAAGQAHPVILSLRFRGAALDPTLQSRDIRTLDDVLREEQVGMRMGALAIGLVTLSVLLLSAAGLYALMSFTITRRRREIGNRAALGAHPRRLLASIFSRALGQLALGITAGIAAAALLDHVTGSAFTDGRGAALLPAVAALMLIVGLLAALGPARRGLRIEPTEALRAE